MSQSVKQIVVGSVAFLALAILSLASAQNQLELASHKDLESLEGIQEVLRNALLLLNVDNETVTSNDNARCSCRGRTCKCCQRIRCSKLRLNHDSCLRVTYLKYNYGIRVTFKLGGRNLFCKKIYGKYPPPICIGVPALRRCGSVCIQFYHLYYGKRSFGGCVRFLGRLLYTTVANVNLGCFRMCFLNATELNETMELPYYDGPEDNDNNGPEVIDNNGPEVIDNNGPEVIDNNGPEVIDNNGPEVIDNNGPEVNDNNRPEVIDNNEPEVNDNNGPEVNDNNGPEVIDNNGPEVIDNNGPEVVKNNEPLRFKAKVTMKKINPALDDEN